MKQTPGSTTYLFAVVLLLLSSASMAATHAPANDRPIDRSSYRVYDCAANSLFTLCRVTNHNIGYKECLRLLPNNPTGNSMKEVKQALESVGFNVKALKIAVEEIPNVKVPSILWTHPPQQAVVSKDPKRLGHYLVVLPLGGARLQILDYPVNPVVLSADAWGRHLRSMEITDMPVLLCGQKSQLLSDMFSTEYPQPYEDRQERSPGDSSLILKANMRETMLHWDFGDIAEGAVIKRVFTITNSTKRQLTISRLSKSCKCSDVKTDINDLAPGQSADITATVSLAGKRGDQSISAGVVFDQKCQMSPVRILITGKSHSKWLLAQQVINLGVIRPRSQKLKADVAVTRTEYGINSQIAQVRCAADFVDVEFQPAAQNSGEPGTLIIRVDPEKRRGRFRETVDILAYGQKEPALSFFVQGEIYAEVSASPPRLLLSPSNSHRAVLRLTHIEEKPLSLKSTNVLGIDNESLKITQVSPTEGQLTLEVRSLNSLAGIKTATIILELTSAADMIHKIEIPVVCSGN